MMQEFYEAHVRRIEAENLRRLMSVETRDQAEAYVQDVQKRIR